MPQIRVISLDFDGCLHRQREDDIIASNINFLNHLMVTNNDFDENILMLGTNRQSIDIDINNSFLTGLSCFASYQEISTFLQTQLDAFLLEDLVKRREFGSSFHNAVERGIEDDRLDTGAIIDEYKISLLYIQMCKIASEHIEDDIYFDFYDDRQDILNALHNFFTNHREMIPVNVVLNLHLYKGGIIDAIPRTCAQGTALPQMTHGELLNQFRAIQFICRGDDPNRLHISNDNLSGALIAEAIAQGHLQPHPEERPMGAVELWMRNGQRQVEENPIPEIPIAYEPREERVVQPVAARGRRPALMIPVRNGLFQANPAGVIQAENAERQDRERPQP